MTIIIRTALGLYADRARSVDGHARSACKLVEQDHIVWGCAGSTPTLETLKAQTLEDLIAAIKLDTAHWDGSALIVHDRVENKSWQVSITNEIVTCEEIGTRLFAVGKYRTEFHNFVTKHAPGGDADAEEFAASKFALCVSQLWGIEQFDFATL